MAIKDRKKREITAYLPEDLVLSTKVDNYLMLKNSGLDKKEYSKSHLVVDALNHFFKKFGNPVKKN